MIASLPMYDRPETTLANDRFWQRIRTRLQASGVVACEALDRSPDYFRVWTRSDLLLSQTCSLPYRTKLAGRVRIVGTPDIKLRGCPAGYYCSMLIANVTDRRRTLAEFDGSILAYNDALSQSGWAAPQREAARLGISFDSFKRTSTHENSAAAVASGIADIAGIDAHTWRLIRRFNSCTAGLRVVARTAYTPGLPLITARQELAGLLFDAVGEAIEMTGSGDLELLPFKGLVEISEARYSEMQAPPPPSGS